MWLAETAVDLETLELLGQQGILFTILSPSQAARVLPHQSRKWIGVSNGSIDSRRPYRVVLPSGGEMNLFFYDRAISRAVAFERLLQNGELFADRLIRGFDGDGNDVQLVNIATDGETYGHHHRFGEMALAYTLELIEKDHLAQTTIYGEFLECFPPQDIVEIREDTSWSCSHGVGRWSSNCGCHTGGEPDWNQKWRRPLRDALNWLRDQAAVSYEREMGRLVRDPWAARDHYVEVILDPDQWSRFLSDHATGPLAGSDSERVRVLLELQRNALMMFTSCGWFFNDISGIETVQILRYARRVIELGDELFQAEWEPYFLKLLSKAESNIPEEGTGTDVYKKHVRCTEDTT